MDRVRVGEDRGSKETDGCPLTVKMSCCPLQYSTCRVEDKHKAKIWKLMTT
jgi:hypothetical protein